LKFELAGSLPNGCFFIRHSALRQHGNTATWQHGIIATAIHDSFNKQPVKESHKATQSIFCNQDAFPS
jgi:hypothetical protein